LLAPGPKKGLKRRKRAELSTKLSGIRQEETSSIRLSAVTSHMNGGLTTVTFSAPTVHEVLQTRDVVGDTLWVDRMRLIQSVV